MLYLKLSYNQIHIYLICQAMVVVLFLPSSCDEKNCCFIVLYYDVRLTQHLPQLAAVKIIFCTGSI